MNFDKHLQAGISRDSRATRNSIGMLAYQGLRCTEFGAKDFYTLNNPFNPEPATAAWPFPMLFIGKKYSWLCYETEIYKVTETTGYWTTTLQATYDLGDLNSLTAVTTKAIPSGGGAWQIMDFHDTVLFFNGVCYVVHTIDGYMYVGEWGAGANGPEISTGCDWRDGRGVMAGFDPANTFDAADWPTLIATYNTTQPLFNQVNNALGGLGPNWVFASSIGGGDLFWLFALDLMKYGFANPPGVPNDAYFNEKLYCLELWKRNEMFLAPMPWQGKALATMELGDHCVVYGGEYDSRAGGVSALVYNGPHIGVYPVQGLGRGVGIASRGCVGGDSEGHVFISDSGDLWNVSPDLKAERLGWAHRLADLDLTETVVTKDPHYNEYYIGDDDMGFVLNRSGLSEATQRAPRVSFAQGGLVCVPFTDDDLGDFVTEAFTRDGNLIGEVSWVRLYGLNDAADPWLVAVDYRVNSASDWTRTDYVEVDGRGIAHVHAPGIEWRIALRCDDTTYHTLENIEAHFAEDGKLNASKWLAAPTPAAATE